MSDKPVRVCPKCKARKVQKLISQTSFQLKGGGWYNDLYASQKPASSSASDSGNGEKAAASSGGDKTAPSSGGDSSASPSKPTDGKGKGKKGASKAAA